MLGLSRRDEGKFSLAAVGSKYDPFALFEYLMIPENFDHSGRMPAMLHGSEGLLLARWLLENRKAELEREPPAMQAISYCPNGLNGNWSPVRASGLGTRCACRGITERKILDA